MEIITIDGMVENDFRISIEDMLRLDQVDEAIVRLRALLETSGCVGPILPARFLEVTAADLEFGGWHRLPDRLLDHDRPNFPITAIGVTLADARQLGGPGPSGGRLSPFIKTFYFSDEAYPFTEATRDDLLDGYSRDGFELQGDYRATDATLSVKGIDDLYGAVIELEGRLFDSPDPAEAEIRAGVIGSCFIAALIHQALRDSIRQKGLPRPLCVFAACDGVYPFFDAPVAGSDECSVAVSALALADDRLAEDTSADVPEDELADDPPGEASLLTLFVRREAKAPVMVLDSCDVEEAARLSDSAAAQRMGVNDADLVRVALDCAPLGEPVDAGFAADGPAWNDAEVLDREELDWPADVAEPRAPSPDAVPTPVAELAAAGLADDDTEPAIATFAAPDAANDADVAECPSDIPDLQDETDPAALEAALEPLIAPAGHSLRARIRQAQPEAKTSRWAGVVALLARMWRQILRR